MPPKFATSRKAPAVDPRGFHSRDFYIVPDEQEQPGFASLIDEERKLNGNVRLNASPCWGRFKRFLLWATRNSR